MAPDSMYLSSKGGPMIVTVPFSCLLPSRMMLPPRPYPLVRLLLPGLLKRDRQVARALGRAGLPRAEVVLQLLAGLDHDIGVDGACLREKRQHQEHDESKLGRHRWCLSSETKVGRDGRRSVSDQEEGTRFEAARPGAW
jgi:hypothetical protein